MKGKSILLILLITFAAIQITYGQSNNVYIGAAACGTCHTAGGAAAQKPTFDSWKGTLHAVAHDSISAQNAFYGYECLQCHNTGWDPALTNRGADEFVIKDTTKTPNYVITDQTKWNLVKNVGCEACHGPMGDASSGQLSSTHWGFGTTNKPSYSAAVCGSCHQGDHDPFFEEWKLSGHAKSTQSSFIVNNKACVRCHVAQSFVLYISNPSTYRDTLLVTGADITPITCATCHDPHSRQNSFQLRFASTNKAVICDECHNAEIDSVDVNVAPHHATSEIFAGKNFGFHYPGTTYQNSAHPTVVSDTNFLKTKGLEDKLRCMVCHMHTDPYNNITKKAVVGHTFSPSPKACMVCHTDYTSKVDTSNHAKQFDYRGMQTKTDSLINALATKLKGASKADSATLSFKQANYNLLAAQAEGSHGIHNTKLVQQLLVDAITNFTPTSVEALKGVPVSYSLSQNYPNPFNPTTQIKFSIAQAGNVAIRVYDAIGNEIETLHNGYLAAGNYSVSWNASRYSSGVYYYKITAGNFEMVKKMLLVK
jgi:predicted CXXCH cytochrome family protein